MISSTFEASNFSSLKNFISYRESKDFENEELPLENFGFGYYERRGFLYPKQLDRFWDSYPYLLVDLTGYRLMSRQLTVYSKTLNHYLMTPLLASPLGNTIRDGIVPHALFSKVKGTIYLEEGNHRCVAALISRRPLLMKLAPLSTVKIDYKAFSSVASEDTPNSSIVS